MLSWQTHLVEIPVCVGPRDCLIAHPGPLVEIEISPAARYSRRPAPWQIAAENPQASSTIKSSRTGSW